MSLEFESEDLSSVKHRARDRAASDAGGHQERGKTGRSVDAKLERIRGGNGRWIE
jgi:hypothetical protein